MGKHRRRIDQALDEELDRPPAQLVAMQARSDYLGVIQNQEIAALQMGWEVGDTSIDGLITIHAQHATAVPTLQRFLRDEVGRQYIVKI